jgi:hypothetical protein
MAIEIRGFPVTIPAGTAITAGFSADISFPARVITQIDVLIPPGPRGEVGVGVGMAGVTVVPKGGTKYIIADDKLFTFPLENLPDSGAWSLYGYNTGTFDHTVTVYFYLEQIAAPAAAAGAPPPDNGGLSSGGGTGTGAGGGTGDQGGGTPPVTVPPVTVPPITVPPPATAPILLPPALPPLPGQGSPVLPADADTLLVGVSDLGVVYLLSGESYSPLTSQDDADALVAAGVAAATVSAATHQALIAASSASVQLVLGPEILAGLFTWSHG